VLPALRGRPSSRARFPIAVGGIALGAATQRQRKITAEGFASKKI